MDYVAEKTASITKVEEVTNGTGIDEKTHRIKNNFLTVCL